MMFLNIIKDLFNFEEAVKNNDFLGILIFIIFILGFLTVYFYKLNRKTEKENKKELKEIQEDILNKEKESEREIMDVLNGVSTILKMSEQSDKYETEKILTAIQNLENRIIDKLDNIKKI